MKIKYEYESGVTIKYEDWKRGLINAEKVTRRRLYSLKTDLLQGGVCERFFVETIQAI
jgi:hypothetical protein